MVDRKCTHHNWCAFRKISKCGEVEPSLPDLDNLLLTLVQVVLARTLALIGRPDLGALPGEVDGTSAIEASVRWAWTNGWWSVRPWAVLLLVGVMKGTVLLGRPGYPSPLLRGSLRRLRSAILYQMILRWWGIRGSGWYLPLFLGTVCHNAVLLSDG